MFGDHPSESEGEISEYINVIQLHCTKIVVVRIATVTYTKMTKVVSVLLTSITPFFALR